MNKLNLGINGGILVKCGGFSTQLANHVKAKVDGNPLWGSGFDFTNPSEVIRTHLDFLQNGAQIILSNTYQSSVDGYMKHLNLSSEESVALMRRSVQLTKEAKKQHIQNIEDNKGTVEPGLPLVLGSVGPYGAMLHDFSEYEGSYSAKVSKEDLQKWHRIRIDALLAENVDGLAVETIPCQMEGEAVAELILKEYPMTKFWVSFQCKDDMHLAHGDNFANAAKSIWDMVKKADAIDRFFGVGVNCVHPNFVGPLLKSLHAVMTEKDLPPLVVYSNRGEVFDAKEAEWMGGDMCRPLETYVPEWIRLGVTIIGGCCRVYPSDILAIRKCIDNIGNNNKTTSS